MALIVQKFGGSSVKDRDRIFNVARIVANTHNAGNDVVVVVSAQGDTTDDLITKAAEITHNPSAREMDMLLAAGEEISIALLAMALNELGCHATSLTGWQAGFRTDRAYTKARITKLETERISSELERNRIVVVAGFQGLNKLDDITTLGRGGSDTSAVAIAAALHADRCQIFTDVEGVYTADPRKVRNTRKLDEITFDEMLELASLGAQVLNNRSVELAKKYNVELEVLSSLNPVPGTVVKEVVKDVEVDNQFRFRQRQFIHQIGQRMNKWQDNQAPHQLKQQAAQRHPARRRVRRAVVKHRQQPRSQVGANHQTQRHRERDRSRRGQRRR